MWRNWTVCFFASVLCATVGARLGLWAGYPTWESAFWGFVVGLVLAHGDRRTAPRHRAVPRDRSGVIGSTVDTPPARTIIQQ